MKRCAIKALTLLTVYLLSTVGAACVALTCRCEHLHHHDADACLAVECCCGHLHASHAADCDMHHDETAVQADARCCNHDHSTDTALYTADSGQSDDMRITAPPCPHADAVAGTAGAEAVVLTALEKSFAERRCPPAQKCRTACRPLRAPPVCA